jgi:hypothetical protein
MAIHALTALVTTLSASNHNLSETAKELFCWHDHLGHASLKRVQLLLQLAPSQPPTPPVASTLPLPASLPLTSLSVLLASLANSAVVLLLVALPIKLE